MLQHPFATCTSGKLSPVYYDGFGTKNTIEFNLLEDTGIQVDNPNDIVVFLKTNFVPGTRVIFWGANPQTKSDYSAKLSSERRAFFGFRNSGHTVVNDTGWISCRLATPRPYIGNGGEAIGRHIYVKRLSKRGNYFTNTLYAASRLPSPHTRCRRISRIKSSNTTILSVLNTTTTLSILVLLQQCRTCCICPKTRIPVICSSKSVDVVLS